MIAFGNLPHRLKIPYCIENTHKSIVSLPMDAMLNEPTLSMILSAGLKDCLDGSTILLLIAGISLLLRPKLSILAAPLILSAVLTCILAIVFPSYAPRGEWILFLVFWSPVLIHLFWSGNQYRTSRPPCMFPTLAAQGITFLGFILLVISVAVSLGLGSPIDWRFIHASGILLIVFYLIMEIAPWRFFGFISSRETARVLMYTAIGVFILRGGMWSYGLFNAAIKERPGSFRLKGVMYSESMTKSWRFPELHTLIMDYWYYPINPKQEEKTIPCVQNPTLLPEGLQKAETFRRSLFESNEKNGVKAELIAQAVVEFQSQAKSQLIDRFPIDRFTLDPQTILEHMAGSEFEIDSRDTLGPFTGRWFGNEESSRVDRKWRPLETCVPPIDIPGSNSLMMHVSQFGWIGDGFGWNAFVSIPNPSDPQSVKSLLLGIVYHVKDQDRASIVDSHPYVGLPLIYGQIIWITDEEILFDEIIPTLRKYNDSYTMTGFKYIIDNQTLKNTGSAFQVFYSRNPSIRKSFYPFDIHLEISNPE